MDERPGPMEKEPEDMSIGVVRSASSIFSGFWKRGMEYNRAILREEVSRADNDSLEASEKAQSARRFSR
jgi:hypothetical protein